MMAHRSGAASAQFQPVTEADLRRYTDAGSISNGRSYQRAGYISRETLRGATLSGLCQGSSGGPYRVEAELVPVGATAPGPVASWDCTCPRGGFCKHVVALLLTWNVAPEAFAPRRPVGEVLAEKSREELLDLLTGILTNHPELIDYVEAALPAPAPAEVAQAGAQPTLDRRRIESQVRQAFEQADDYDGRGRRGYGRYGGWDEGGESVDIAVLTRLRASADDYADAGRWADAQLVYAAIVERATEGADEHYYDDEGELLEVVAECVAGLVRCVEVQETLPTDARLAASEREALLETLYAAWSYSLDYHIEGADDLPGLIARHATAPERATVESRLRDSLTRGSALSRPDLRRAMVAFLLALQRSGGVDDEAMIEEYRAAGLWDEVAGRQLRLGQIDEALATARQHLRAPGETLNFAASLLALGGEQVGRALDFVEDRLSDVGDLPAQDFGPRDGEVLLTWLGQQYGLHGQPDRALELAWRRFAALPSERTYAAVQAAATLPEQPAGRWQQERRKLLLALEERGAWGAMVNIFLDEGEVGEALTALGEMERRAANPAAGGYAGYWHLGDQTRRVAEAAEIDYPERALGLYQRLAQGQIDQRSRSHYQQAADYLDRARNLYRRLDRAVEWEHFIRDLRDRHRTLRALRQELDARGLG